MTCESIFLVQSNIILYARRLVMIMSICGCTIFVMCEHASSENIRNIGYQNGRTSYIGQVCYCRASLLKVHFVISNLFPT